MSKYQITIQCESEAEFRSTVNTLTNRSDTSEPTATVQTDVQVPASVPSTPEKTETPASSADPDEMAVDADGMPYDPAVHSPKRAINQDGTWKAKKGQAEAAKAARAAFKAGGGGVTPPALPTSTSDPQLTQSAPIESVKTALPGLGAIPAQEPVTFDQFFAKVTEVLNADKVKEDDLVKFYGDVTGCATTEEAVEVLQTNESVRAAGVAQLNSLLVN